MINLGAIAPLLRPGLAAITGQFPTYAGQYTEIFKTYESDKNQEFEVEMKYTGLATIKPEGSPQSVDTMGFRYTSSYQHKTIAISFNVTMEAIQDNLYSSQFPQQARSLRDSLANTKEVLGAFILNNGFNPNYPGGDGQPLFSISHPIDGGVYTNTLPTGAAADFSEAAVEQMIIQIQKMPMQSGILAKTMPLKIILPREIQFNASRLLNSAFRVTTANNDINALYTGNYIPQGYKVNQFLQSPYAYFILTDAPDGLKHYQRSAIETDTYVDFPTKSIGCSGMERYSFGWTNPRAAFGSPGM